MFESHENTFYLHECIWNELLLWGCRSNWGFLVHWLCFGEGKSTYIVKHILTHTHLCASHVLYARIQKVCAEFWFKFSIAIELLSHSMPSHQTQAPRWKYTYGKMLGADCAPGLVKKNDTPCTSINLCIFLYFVFDACLRNLVCAPGITSHISSLGARTGEARWRFTSHFSWLFASLDHMKKICKFIAILYLNVRCQVVYWCFSSRTIFHAIVTFVKFTHIHYQPIALNLNKERALTTIISAQTCVNTTFDYTIHTVIEFTPKSVCRTNVVAQFIVIIVQRGTRTTCGRTFSANVVDQYCRTRHNHIIGTPDWFCQTARAQ